MDETGITTVLSSPKVIAEKEKKQVGQILSAERGELVTFCAIINVIGNTIPPAFVLPRIRYKDDFLIGAWKYWIWVSKRMDGSRYILQSIKTYSKKHEMFEKYSYIVYHLRK